MAAELWYAGSPILGAHIEQTRTPFTDYPEGTKDQPEGPFRAVAGRAGEPRLDGAHHARELRPCAVAEVHDLAAVRRETALRDAQVTLDEQGRSEI